MIKRGLFLVAASVIHLTSTQALAREKLEEQPPPAGAVGGRLPVGLETEVFNVGTSSSTARQNGTELETTSNSANLTLGGVPPALVVGYGLDDAWLLSGALSFSRWSAESSVEDTTETSVSVSPALSFLFDGGAVRPFVGAHGSMLSGSGYAERFSAGGGAHGGLRVQVADNLSLDPMLRAGYLWFDSRYPEEALSNHVQSHVVHGSLAARLSGWF